jgi:hypothetical protein
LSYHAEDLKPKYIRRLPSFNAVSSLVSPSSPFEDIQQHPVSDVIGLTTKAYDKQQDGYPGQIRNNFL